MKSRLFWCGVVVAVLTLDWFIGKDDDQKVTVIRLDPEKEEPEITQEAWKLWFALPPGYNTLQEVWIDDRGVEVDTSYVFLDEVKGQRFAIDPDAIELLQHKLMLIPMPDDFVKVQDIADSIGVHPFILQKTVLKSDTFILVVDYNKDRYMFPEKRS